MDVNTNETTIQTGDALPVGTQLNHYIIQSVLGQGAFGITYLATEQHLERAVAIKEYFPTGYAIRNTDQSVSARLGKPGKLFRYGLESFLAEAKTIVRFKHPNIVRVLTYFEHHQTAYLVMEYETGLNLDAYIKAHPELPESRLREIFLLINQGLSLMHQQGYIHRDIKPDNIYIRNDNSPVLLDFGAARDVFKRHPNDLTRIFTEEYAPYEQSNPDWANQGPWTDIYALGGTLYFAVTGKTPANAQKRVAATMREEADPYEKASLRAKGLYSEAFLAAIDYALAFLPQERPQSVEAWNQALSADAASTLPATTSTINDSDQQNIASNSDTLIDLEHSPYSTQADHTLVGNFLPPDDIAVTPAEKRSSALFKIAMIALALMVAVALFSAYTFMNQKPVQEQIQDNTASKENNSTSTLSFEKQLENTLLHAHAMAKQSSRKQALQQTIKDYQALQDLNFDQGREDTLLSFKQNLVETRRSIKKHLQQYADNIAALRQIGFSSLEPVLQNLLEKQYADNHSYQALGLVLEKHISQAQANPEDWRKDIQRITE